MINNKLFRQNLQEFLCRFMTKILTEEVVDAIEICDFIDIK